MSVPVNSCSLSLKFKHSSIIALLSGNFLYWLPFCPTPICICKYILQFCFLIVSYSLWIQKKFCSPNLCLLLFGSEETTKDMTVCKMGVPISCGWSQRRSLCFYNTYRLLPPSLPWQRSIGIQSQIVYVVFSETRYYLWRHQGQATPRWATSVYKLFF